MNAGTYQELAMRTAGPALAPQDDLSIAALGLCGETGEFADHVKKHLFHGHVLDVPKARKELGDIAWYLARACTALDINLNDVLYENIEKLRARYPEGFSSERSINRVE